MMLSGASSATLVAGWDFSQYLGDALLTTDGVTGADTLSANYSNLDPTFSAGAESAAFGRMYIDGEYGSTAVNPLESGRELPFEPLFPTLAANRLAPLASGQAGAVAFDSYSVLLSEGQLFANSLSMMTNAPVDVVFKADLSSVQGLGANWSLSFGATSSSGDGTIAIAVSTDGASYAPVSSGTPSNVDVNLGSMTAQTIFVRLSITPGTSSPLIDNVALNASLVPEPDSSALVAVLLLGVPATVGWRFRKPR
jgi:hypothetical protein